MWPEPVNVDALLIGVSPVVVYILVGLVIGLESTGIPLPGLASSPSSSAAS